MMLGADSTANARGGHPVWHLLIVAMACVAVFVGIKAWEWWRAYVEHRRGLGVAGPGLGSYPRRRPRDQPHDRLVVGVALASAGCSATHAAVGPAHFREAAAFGVFFLAASAFQAAWAVLIVRRAGRLLLAIGAAANAAVLVLWALTRTVGLPLGPDMWRPEAVSGPDLFASLLELTVVLGASWLLWDRAHRVALAGLRTESVDRLRRAPHAIVETL